MLKPAICNGPGLADAGIDCDLDVLSFLCSQVKLHGQNSVSLIHASGEQDKTLTYAQIWQRAGSIHHGLVNQNLSPGDIAIVAVSELGDLISALWACWMAGIVPMPIPLSSTRMSEWRHDLDRALAQLLPQKRLRALIHDQNTALKPPAREVPTLPIEVLAAEPPDFTVRSLPGTTPGVLFSSSGSTGVPKLVVLSRQALSVRLQQSSTSGQSKAGSGSALYWLPPHQAATCLRVMAPDKVPKTVLSTEAFIANPCHWFDLIEQHKIDKSMMTSFGMGLLLRAAEQDPQHCWDLSSLMNLGIGAEPISPHTLRRFLALIEKFGVTPNRVYVGYGMTEAGTITSGPVNVVAGSSSDEGSFALPVGEPCPGYGVRVVQKDHSLCVMGEVGLIEVCSPSAAEGYLGKRHASSRLRCDDGWLRTGDLGFIQGRQLTVTGRRQDVVIMNARKYSCHQIELALQQSLGCSDADVVACAVREHSDHTEALLIFFNPGAAAFNDHGCASESASSAALDQAVTQLRRSLLQSMGLTARAFIPLAPERLPRTPAGKVKRSALTRAFLDGRLAREGDPPEGQAAQQGEPAPVIDGSKQLDATPHQQLLLDLWRRQFTGQEVGLHDDFFELGGDSITAVALLTAIEQHTGWRLALGNLSAFSTIADLAVQMDALSNGQDVAGKTTLEPEVEQRLRKYLGGWPGERRATDALLVGFQVECPAMPLFWCCQGYQELQTLAEKLGPEQPVYGMRSLHLIAPWDSDQVIQLAHCYCEEITVIAKGSPVAIGGNCQGSYVALELARMLLKRGLEVSVLFLLEHHRPSPYPGRVVLLHGADRFADPHIQYINPELGWRAIYPAGFSVSGIDCKHGKFFQPPNISALAELIGHGITATTASPSWEANHASLTLRPAIGFGASVTLLAPIQPTAQLSWRVPAAVTNLSSTPWPPTQASGVRLGAVVAANDGNWRRLPLEGADLWEAVLPGDTLCLELTLDLSEDLPELPGEALLSIDLVQEGVTWFRHRGGRALQLSLNQDHSPLVSLHPMGG